VAEEAVAVIAVEDVKVDIVAVIAVEDVKVVMVAASAVEDVKEDSVARGVSVAATMAEASVISLENAKNQKVNTK